jgi:hypothetical protein
MKAIWLPIALLFFFSCTNHHVEPAFVAQGTWVEKSLGKDTIRFGLISNDGVPRHFSFSSHKNISGYAMYSTIYEFNLSGNTISLYNTISSCYCFEDYLFYGGPDELHIENFYDVGRKGKMETFLKISP